MVAARVGGDDAGDQAGGRVDAQAVRQAGCGIGNGDAVRIGRGGQLQGDAVALDVRLVIGGGQHGRGFGVRYVPRERSRWRSRRWNRSR